MAVIIVPWTCVDHKMMDDAFVSLFYYWLKLKNENDESYGGQTYLRGSLKRPMREISVQARGATSGNRKMRVTNKMFNL